MRVKDIVNRDIINLTNCEHEPIHIPGSIQPHGFLLGLKEHDFTIDFCSENCSDYIQATHQQLLGKNFFTVFGKDTEDKFKNFIDAGLKDVPASLMMNLNGIDFLCTVHKSGNIFVFECEPEMQEQHDVPDTFEQTRQFLSGIQQTQSLQQLCDSVVRSTRDITGYDRVMVYRFDEQYNGEVFAESVREDLEPFLVCITRTQIYHHRRANCTREIFYG